LKLLKLTDKLTKIQYKLNKYIAFFQDEITRLQQRYRVPVALKSPASGSPAVSHNTLDRSASGSQPPNHTRASLSLPPEQQPARKMQIRR
jgi:hypothetical protein